MINGFTWDLPESIQAKHMFMHYSCCKYMKSSPRISLEWCKTFLFQQWSWNENLYIIDECSHAPPPREDGNVNFKWKTTLA